MHHSTFPGSARALLVAFLSLGAVSATGAQSAAQAVSAVPVAERQVPAALVPGLMVTGTPATPAAAAQGPAEGASVPRAAVHHARPAGLTARNSQHLQEELAAPMLKQETGATRTNTALMIVGAAAVVLGAAVGDDAGTVLIITGAGIGLYGLYRLLN